LDIGISPDIMAGNIIGVVAQRLVRVLCTHCKEAYEPSEEERRVLGIKYDTASSKIYHNVGCKRCNYSGYRGRMAILELLRIDSDLDSLIARRAHLDELREAAIEKGFTMLAEDGIRRILEGFTTIAEVSRVVDLTGRLH
jgi:general secretion pathway protein E/type IV pilus assembly protein PilB